MGEYSVAVVCLNTLGVQDFSNRRFIIFRSSWPAVIIAAQFVPPERGKADASCADDKALHSAIEAANRAGPAIPAAGTITENTSSEPRQLHNFVQARVEWTEKS